MGLFGVHVTGDRRVEQVTVVVRLESTLWYSPNDVR
jgi:hypothetical protein